MKEFIEALKARIRDRWVPDIPDIYCDNIDDEIDASAASWPSSEHNPENCPAPAGKIDTSPAALRALATVCQGASKGPGPLEYLAEVLRAVADEKESQAVPEGWNLVPAEPTNEMHKAGAIEMNQPYGTSARAVFLKMLSAAPQPPEGPKT